jgi:hypothetical protein
LQYWGRSNTHQHWFAIGLRFGQKFFNVAFCSYLHHQYFNWAAVPGRRISNSPTSQSPIVGSNIFAALQYLQIIMERLFYLAILTTFIYSCSPKIGSTITSKQPPLPDTAFVLVLQEQDDFINDGIEIGTIKSGDNGLSNNCSYFEVLDKLKLITRQSGANVIKITEQKSPDNWSSCVRLKATIYKVPNFRIHEKEIYWTADRKLSWEDFKGSPKTISNTNTAAQTYCGFGFQTNQVSTLTKTKIFTTNIFTCNLSWVREDQKSRIDLLEHEQGHFDLCEVYSRQLRKKLIEKKLTVYNINTDANIIFKSVYALYLDRQELYEKETNYGLDRQKQIEWTKKIENEIKDLSSFTQ